MEPAVARPMAAERVEAVRTAAPPTATREGPPNPSTVPWESVGFGVAHKAVPNPLGDDTFIAYGGYTAKLEYTQAWSEELFRARLGALGIGHIYAVQGPNTAGYTNLEIENSKLIQHLLGYAQGVNRILIAAHSSGALVAHELLGQLVGGLDPAGLSAGKIDYFNLDGGGSGFGAEERAYTRSVFFVYAQGAAGVGQSANAATMELLAQTPDELVVVDASGSGCNPGAKWCLHDALIIRQPANPDAYDLEADYQGFSASNPVVTDYLDALTN